MKNFLKIFAAVAVLCAGALFAWNAAGGALSSPAVSTDAPQLVLVNSENAVPAGWSEELTTLSNGEQVATLIYPDLQEMFDDMRSEGVYPFVRAGYRSNEEQQRVLDERISAYENEGYSHARAEALALETVALPGTSEHELGLAVDINAQKDKSTADEVYAWLEKNAYKYGFIQRYPQDKSDITGIDYEPWHYRYVGRQAAREIYEAGVCLEEYLGKG